MESLLRDGVQLQAITARAFAGDSHFFEDNVTPDKIREQLESNQDPDKLKGMKQLLAMISKGRDVPEFFPDVVKNVVVRNIEVKKLVYMYLVHYADFDHSCREIALLSINSFQKDLSDSNQFVRGLALRVMTSVRVPDIIQIQLLAVRKCASDTSPYVRKCAANALPKIVAFDPDQLEAVQQILGKLMGDNSTMVLGSAMAAFNEVCPTAYELVHAQYRKLCQLLADMDEWTQVPVLDVLTRYARSHFHDPAPHAHEVMVEQERLRSTAVCLNRGKLSQNHAESVAPASNGHVVRRKVRKQAFYSDEESEEVEEDVFIQATGDEVTDAAAAYREIADDDLDTDHALLLRSSLPLLKSRNPAVVLAVAVLHYYVGTPYTHSQVVAKALVRILRGRRESVYIVLQNIHMMCVTHAAVFRAHLHDFFITSSDTHFHRILKLKILAQLCTSDNVKAILSELNIYIKDPNVQFAQLAIRTVGMVCDADPSLCTNCIQGLMMYVQCTQEPALVSECVQTLRVLIQQAMSINIQHNDRHVYEDHASNICMHALQGLVKLLLTPEGAPHLSDPASRAAVIWLVGEYHDYFKRVYADILRLLAKAFVEEAVSAKTQILTLAVKLACVYPSDDNVQSLMTYLFELARYDSNVDVRDRARMLTALMGLGSEAVDEEALEAMCAHAGDVMLAPKLPPITLGGISTPSVLTMGTLSAVLGFRLPHYQDLGPWTNNKVQSRLRDAKDGLTSGVRGGDSLRDLMVDVRGEQSKGTSDQLYSSSSSSSSSRSESDSDSDSDSDSNSSESDSSDSDNESDSSRTSSSSTSSSSSSSSGTRPRPRTATVQAVSRRGQGSPPPSVLAPKAGDSHHLPALTNDSDVGATVSRAPIRKVGKRGAGQSSTFTQAVPPTGAAQPLQAPITSSLLDLPEQPVMLLSSATTLHALPGQTQAIMQTRSSTDHIHDMLGLGGLDAPLPQPHGDLLDYSPPSSSIPAVSSTITSVPPQPGDRKVQSILASFDSPKVPGPSAVSTPGSVSATAPVGGASLSGGMPAPIFTFAPTAPHSAGPAKTAVRADISGGLHVYLYILRDATPSSLPDGHICHIYVSNTREYSVRRVKLGLPADLRKTPLPDIALLEPGQCACIYSEMVLQTHKQVKVEVRSDRGTGAGAITLTDTDLMTPLICSVEEFQQQRSRLAGFNEVSRAYSLDSLNLPKDGGREAARRIMRAVGVAMVKDGERDGDVLFAGKVRKSGREERALISLLVDSASATLRVNCDDAVFCSSFHDDIKRVVSQA